MNLQVEPVTYYIVLSFYNLEELMPTKWTEEVNIPKKREIVANKPATDQSQDATGGFTSDSFGLTENVYR
jgi:hypothetical protein